ncbi:copper resistance protein CopC [Oryzobacter sp. R7]|uniref:copper resistance CopC family protein n=1 Tax=Oryzobacter faecalis TaxID=3388656 RepID=UPI00398D2E77
MFSRRASAIVIVALVLLALLAGLAPVFAAPASAAPSVLPAHARLTGSTPADGSTVATADEVVLTFTEDVDPTFVEVVVDGPDGAAVDAAPKVEGREVTQALGDTLPAGRYTVTYRVVSADGHPISGTVSFTTTTPVGPSPSPSAAVSEPAPTPTADDVPAAEDGGPGPWPWLVGVVLVAGLAALVTRRRLREGRAADAGDDAEPDRERVEAHRDRRDDPFA